ncbi:MAG TPA: cell wall hydrolase [Caulobacteraceae bacterium]|nr:cell wall hydrolase [Caulobacteraceae bacterium]
MSDAAALAGLCALLAYGGQFNTISVGSSCPRAVQAVGAPASRPPPPPYAHALVAPGARDGIARVAYAEAGNQGDSGLAAVIYTILNRLSDGRWGASVDAVLDARAQFEPVLRAGGDWRRLPPVSPAKQARVDTILNLALDGRLPDLTHGARYFQNPVIVSRRAQAGEVAASLVNFGGSRPSAVIGAHSFFVGVGRGGGSSAEHAPSPRTASSVDVLFVGDNRAISTEVSDAPIGQTPAAGGPSANAAGDPSQALFVGRDGALSAGKP